jgi:hypothetical protein
VWGRSLARSKSAEIHNQKSNECTKDRRRHTDFNPVQNRQKDVFRLDIPMDDICRVQVIQSKAYLSCEAPYFLFAVKKRKGIRARRSKQVP